MSNPTFSKGDRVLHTERPEWGIGAIVKAERLTVNDQPAQRLTVRFPNAGLKTLSTSHATLQLVTDGAPGVGATKARFSPACGPVADERP